MHRASSISKKIDLLIAKASYLAKQYKLEQEKNDELIKIIETLKKKQEDKIKEIEALNNKIKIIKLAKNIGGDDLSSTIELKKKINEFTKEIDKCISMIDF